MESAAIARVCAKRGVPFLIVRAITDLFDEDLPLDFNLYRNRNGQVDAGKVMRAALLNPKAIAGLLTLQKRSRVCADRLAAFLRDLLPRIP